MRHNRAGCRRVSCYGSGRFMESANMSVEKKLSSLLEFKFAVFLPLIVACICTFIIIGNSNLVFDLTFSGFNEALTIFKVPISIVALIFPLVAFVATNHRSRQTAETLIRNQAQVNFANYYKHREEYFKVLSRLEDELEIRFSDGNGLYRKLFPNNTVNTIELRSKERNSDQSLLEIQAKNYRELLDSIRKPDIREHTVKKFYIELFLLSDALGFSLKKGEILDIPEMNVPASNCWRVAYTEKSPLKHAWIISQVISRLSDFCHIEKDLKLIMFSPYLSFIEHSKQVFKCNFNERESIQP